MPSLDNHQSSKFTKLLLIGDSGTGKTGSLAALANGGYKLRILDMDNGLDPLRVHVKPEFRPNVEFVTLRDKRKATGVGYVIDGQPTAFRRSLEMLDHWKDESTDLGKPADWGPDTVLVIDSLTFLSDAAFDFRLPLVVRGKDDKFDNRMVYKDAQDAIANVLAGVTSEAFHTNVIVAAHIRYQTNPDGMMKGYPTSVGSALNAEIPRYFNSSALTTSKPGGKRVIQTVGTGLIDLKNPAAFKMAPELPIETGLLDFFKTVRS